MLDPLGSNVYNNMLIYLQKEMTAGAVILVVISLAALISAQPNCPPRGLYHSHEIICYLLIHTHEWSI